MLPSPYGVTRPKWVNMYRIKSFLSNDANLIPCQTNLAFLKKLRLFPNEIWPWKFKVKVMSKVKGQGRTVGQTSIQCTSFLFQVNRPNHSIRIPLKLNHIRSMVRGIYPQSFVMIGWVVLTLMWDNVKALQRWWQCDLNPGSPTWPPKNVPMHIYQLCEVRREQLLQFSQKADNPDSKVRGANMGPTWVLSAPDGPHVGPMNIAIREMYPSQWQQAWQRWRNQAKNTKSMMTSSNGNIFRVTGHLCGWIPREKASGAELWCFLWSASE